MALAQFFLQKLSINGTDIPRDFVITCAYMEMIDLEGPQIDVVIRDSTGQLIDNLGIGYGSKMIATLGDPQGSRALWQETFFIVEAPAANDGIHISALAETVRKIHAPSPKAQFYVNQSASDILTQVVPDAKANADAFQLAGTWHLNNGENPVNLVRKMATDNGAIAWLARGFLNVKGIKGILSGAPAFSYEANNPKAPFRINKRQFLNADYAASQSHDYRYVGFSQTEGTVTAGGDGLPVKLVGDTDQIVLQNKTLGLIPKLDCEADGNAGISAGDLIQVLLHRYDNSNTLDESVPKIMVVLRVTHYETRFNYRTRFVLGATYDQLQGLKGMGAGGALGLAKPFTGPEGFDMDGFDLGGFLGKLSQGIDLGLSTLNEMTTQINNVVNQAENTIKDAAGNVIHTVSDAAGNVIKTTTDAAGNVVKETTDAAGNTVREVINSVTGGKP
ncbi:TPA: RHS repeat protein [Enterobacter hormaechei subsp. xiangfangensis]|nr:RHS repeat protein [Enterobacter hormaechei subsp. xiangfangensis]